MSGVLEFLGSPTGLGYIAVIVGGVIWWLSSKSPKASKYVGLAIQAFNWVEKSDLLNKIDKSKKADLFLQKFVEAYKAREGSEPPKSIINFAVDTAERLVLDKNVTIAAAESGAGK